MVILGGAGFLGTYLSKHLAAQGYEVVTFDRHFPPSAESQGVIHILGDFSDRGDLDRLLHEGDICFLLICSTVPGTSNQDLLFDLKNNVEPTLNFLELAASRNVGKVVFSSSGGAVYGPALSSLINESHPTNPISSYGIAKLTVEKYLSLYHRLYGLKVCSLRVGNLYGPWVRPRGEQGAVPVFMTKALAGQPIEIWGDGSITRDYVYIGDVVEAFRRAAELNAGDALFNIGSGRGRSLREVVEAISETSGLNLAVTYSPARACDVPVNVLDIGRAEKDLGWQPRTDFKDGLAETWRSLAASFPQRPTF